eukprot:2850096-Prymnesium_polylepis.1
MGSWHVSAAPSRNGPTQKTEHIRSASDSVHASPRAPPSPPAVECVYFFALTSISMALTPMRSVSWHASK